MSDAFRQNGLIGVTGQQGVGKTHFNNLYAQQYILDNPATRKQGKKVLILDAKEERTYAPYQILQPRDLLKQPQKSIMRMVFRHNNGKAFTQDEKRKLFYFLLDKFKAGMLILEDFNTYALTTKNEDIIGPITTARHNGVDVFFSMQNMSKITKEIWENITWYRFHKQTTPIWQQRHDIENFQLLRIAEIIINDQYTKVNQLYNLPKDHPKKINEATYKKLASFHVWVDFKKEIITGCKEAKFREAALTMIQEDQREITAYCKRQGWNHQNQKARTDATRSMYIDTLKHYRPSPFA